MPAVFISRELAADSPLRRWAAGREVGLIARSLLRFAAVPFTAPEADWWFFYSPRAVTFGLPALAGAATHPQLAAMGEGTAAALEAAGRSVAFTGSGTPAAVAAAFGRVAAGQRVFFPRARQSRKTVQALLGDRITSLDAICYDNQPVPLTAGIAADVYVFTSPLNVAAYVDHVALAAGAGVVAAGPSTGAALAARGIVHYVLPAPGEEAVIDYLEGLFPG